MSLLDSESLQNIEDSQYTVNNSFGGHSKNLIPCRTLVDMATKRKNFKYLLLKNQKS
jgi:hypothetical protein